MLRTDKLLLSLIAFLFSTSLIYAQLPSKISSGVANAGREVRNITRTGSAVSGIGTQVERIAAGAISEGNPHVTVPSSSIQGIPAPRQSITTTQPPRESLGPHSTPPGTSPQGNQLRSSLPQPEQINIKALEANPLEFFNRSMFQPNGQPSLSARPLLQLARQFIEGQAIESSLTPVQRARWEAAKQFFAQLTPELANDLNFLTSPEFRQHATVIRTPQATEYGYYIQGSGMGPHYQDLYASHELRKEAGYISTFAGNPINGVSAQDIQHMINNAVSTQDPIFVLIHMHGGIDKTSGTFVARANEQNTLSTPDIVNYMQKLRQKTGTPQLNLFLSSCYGGAFLDEFAALPLSQREGINVFVYTGRSQFNYTFDAVEARYHTPSANIVQEQIKGMIDQILYKDNLFVQANINGQSFNPIEIATQKAKLLPGEEELATSLEVDLRTQKHGLFGTDRQTALFLQMFNNFSEDAETYVFVACAAKDEAAARYGQLFKVGEFEEKLINFGEKLSNKWGFDIAKENKWHERFGFPEKPIVESEEFDLDNFDLGEFELEP